MHKIHQIFLALYRKKFFLAITILMTIILIDTFALRFYDILDKNLIPLLQKKILFSEIAVGCLIIEFIIVNYVKKLTIKDKTNMKIKVWFPNKLAFGSYCAIAILFSFLIFELFYLEYYHSYFLILIIAISFGAASIFILKSLILFISWFRIKRNLVFFLYSTSMAMILFNLIITNITVNINMIDRPSKIKPYSSGSINISAGKYDYLSNLFKISAVLSFVSIWMTTSLLMYSSKDQIIGKVQYWIILTIPLAYFILSNFPRVFLHSLLYPHYSSDPILISLIITSIFILSKPVGGIVFGISFWRITRLVSFQKILQEYVTISGYGFLLLFSANQAASLVLMPYPPTGIITVTVLIGATYLIYTGIYKSATMVSSNTQIRKSIYQITKESKLLDLSGRAELGREIENTLSKVINRIDEADLIVDKEEMDEKELRNYVRKLVDEFRKNHLP